MNGVDPSPQDISLENGILHRAQGEGLLLQPAGGRRVDRLVPEHRDGGHPVVGVYETMPTPGYDYQSWMLAEVNSIRLQ